MDIGAVADEAVFRGAIDIGAAVTATRLDASRPTFMGERPPAGIVLSTAGGWLRPRLFGGAAPFADLLYFRGGNVKEFQELLMFLGSAGFEFSMQAAHVLFAETGGA